MREILSTATGRHEGPAVPVPRRGRALYTAAVGRFRMAYEIVRFPYDGTIDADGHVLEPEWRWSEYLEERYRDRAIRIRTDAEGLECLELDGRASERTTKGVLGLLGSMGDLEVKRGPDRRYMDHIPFGAGDAKERVALLDQENLEKSVLYPTLGLLREGEVEGPEQNPDYQRA